MMHYSEATQRAITNSFQKEETETWAGGKEEMKENQSVAGSPFNQECIISLIDPKFARLRQLDRIMEKKRVLEKCANFL